MVEVGVLGPLLARGRTADVYAWRDGYVLKVFHDWFSRDSIEYEAMIGRLVHGAGLPAPLPGEVLSIDGHNALVYERVEGQSMVQAMQHQPWRVVSHARRLAALHARLHSDRFTGDLPDQKQGIKNKLFRASALSGRARFAALEALASMPDGDRLCHGDLHPGNVLVTPHGDVAIDWENAAIGNPLADVARSSIILMGGRVAQPLLSPFSRLFHVAYIREYFRLRPGGEQEYRRWLPIVAAARLSENIPGLHKWLLQQASGLVR